MKRKPKRLTILGRKIKVLYLDKMSEADASGLFIRGGNTIEVRDDEEWELTLLHEVCHAVLDISGLSHWMSEQQEEAIVTALENGLSGLVRFK